MTRSPPGVGHTGKALFRAESVSWFSPGLTGLDFPHRCRGVFGVLLAALLLPAGANANVESLIAQARERQLFAERQWQLLLHTAPGSPASEIDSAGFFLSPRGAGDPADELEATIRALFTEPDGAIDDDHPICRYPARYQWLQRELLGQAGTDFPAECRLLQLWRERYAAQAVTLVFSDYFLGNPASLFGHVFLRFDRNPGGDTHLLDDTVSYSASGDFSNFLGYAWRGLTGGYEGRFSIVRYDELVAQYNNQERRDLWEFELSLDETQLRFMWLHLWEVSEVHFDYFFLDENCAYHLLSLLEVADPSLDLRSRFGPWTLPAETLRVLNSYPGLVRATVRRPSVASRFAQRERNLDAGARKALRDVIDGDVGNRFESLPPQQQAEVYDAAIEWVNYRQALDGKEQWREFRHEVLVQRSRLPRAPNLAPDDTGRIPPGAGHPPWRVTLGAVQYDDDSNTRGTLSIRPGYHDWLAAEGGHAPNSQINYLDLRLQQDADRGDWQTERFALVEILSLVPASHYQVSPSWRFELAWQRDRSGGCDNCRPFTLGGGIGLARELAWFDETVAYGLLDIEAAFDHELEDDHHFATGPSLGALIDINPSWRMALELRRWRYSSGPRDYLTRGRWFQRFDWSQRADAEIGVEWYDDDRILRAELGWYW